MKILIISIFFQLNTSRLIQPVSNRFEFGINLIFLQLCRAEVSIRILLDPLLAVDCDGLDRLLVVGCDVREEIQVLQHVLNLNAVLLQLQTRLSIDSDFLIMLLVTNRLLNHSLSFVLVQLFFDIFNLNGARASGLIIDDFDSEYAVFIDEEVDFDLGNACLGGRDPRHRELPQEMVVLRHRSLTLEYRNLHRVLIVMVGREDLLVEAGNGGVLPNQRLHRTISHQNTKSEGDHILHV